MQQHISMTGMSLQKSLKALARQCLEKRLKSLTSECRKEDGRPMSIGVLALQGDVIEHIRMIKRLNAIPIEIRKKEELENVDALIIPGGESTTISKLIQRNGLDREIIRRAKEGMPIYGTCAGMILLSKKVENNQVTPLGLIDITVKR